MKSKSPLISSRFSRWPVDRSSMTRTRAPFAANVAAMCDPINPAPPVTSAMPERDIVLCALFLGLCSWLFALSSNSYIRKTQFPHVGWVINISQIRDHWILHQVTDTSHIKRAKLVPFSNKYQRISVFNRRVFVLGVLNTGEHLLSFRHGNRIISTDSRTFFS